MNPELLSPDNSFNGEVAVGFVGEVCGPKVPVVETGTEKVGLTGDGSDGDWLRSVRSCIIFDASTCNPGLTELRFSRLFEIDDNAGVAPAPGCKNGRPESLGRDLLS